MKKEAIRTLASIVLALVMAFGLIPVQVYAADAADVPSAWAAGFVENAVALGYVPEALQSAYTDPITRQEFCELVVQFYETFTNKVIEPTEEFYDTENVSVCKAASAGIVAGTGNGNFSPENKLTREQAAAILCNLATALGHPLDAAEPTFADNVKMSSWAGTFVGMVQSAGLMSGKGNNNFDPKGPYTREQSIITMMNVREQQIGLLPKISDISFETASVTLPADTEFFNPYTVFSGDKELEDVVGVVLTSSNEDVAGVTEGGCIHTYAGGVATITATTHNDKRASYQVCVGNQIGNCVIALPVTLKAKLMSNTQARDASDSGEITAWRTTSDVIIKKLEHLEYGTYVLHVDMPFKPTVYAPYLGLTYNLYDKDHELLKTENLITTYDSNETNMFLISLSMFVWGDERYYPFIVEFVE